MMMKEVEHPADSGGVPLHAVTAAARGPPPLFFCTKPVPGWIDRNQGMTGEP
jgi:hypothetical protein